MIEVATERDFSAIGDLNVEAYAEFAAPLGIERWDLMQMSLRNIALRAETAQFMIVRKDTNIVGSIGYAAPGKADTAIFDTDMAAILLLAVHPSQRNSGIARVLIENCIAQAKNDGASSIGLFTSELMQPAQQLYRTFGFSQDAELPARYGVRYFRFTLALK